MDWLATVMLTSFHPSNNSKIAILLNNPAISCHILPALVHFAMLPCFSIPSISAVSVPSQFSFFALGGAWPPRAGGNTTPRDSPHQFCHTNLQRQESYVWRIPSIPPERSAAGSLALFLKKKINSCRNFCPSYEEILISKGPRLTFRGSGSISIFERCLDSTVPCLRWEEHRATEMDF